MRRPSSRLLSTPAFLVLSLSVFLPGLRSDDDQDRMKVGVQDDGRILVPTNQLLKPAGTPLTFPGRPVDLAFADDGKTLVVKNMRSLVFVDVAAGKIKQTLALPNEKEKAGFSVTGLLVQGDRVFASDSLNHVRVARRQTAGAYAWEKPLALEAPKVGGAAHPAGLASSREGLIWVTSTRGNSVQLLDPESGSVRQTVAVGVAPFMVFQASPNRCYVSNWGGDLPAAGQAQARSSDSPIRIDAGTGVANQGTVSVLALESGKWRQVKTIPVGLHPSGMVFAPGGGFLYVANANSDTVSVIATASDSVVETIDCRPVARLPFGSGSNALALSPSGDTLYVANGTNNCLAVVALGRKAMAKAPVDRPEASTLTGLIPTAWYPGGVQVSPDGTRLYVTNIKGFGSLSQPRPPARGKQSHDHLGVLSIIAAPDDVQLQKYTREVHENNRVAYALAGLDKPRPDSAPVPVPARHGEPSLFKHIVYIIKENRTYDQVLGDMKEGNGDPRLVMFGEEVTPNHHALARQFTLFDNFYCSGVLSADGHSWVNEAYVTDYLERAFGGFTRSYPDDGSDPLAYPSTGFLWNNALKHARTFRNFGEFVNPKFAPKGTTWADLYRDYRNGTRKVKLDVRANIEGMRPYTHPGYPWFPLLAPDVYRAQVFMEELKEYENKGEMPNLVYLTLPCDHTEGTNPDWPTPRAMVADNDLALGQIVEAISHSKFWPETCIFVVEDDPQNGFDHVDAHRTVALVISPYTKRRFVDHTNYNQTGMVKTIELILGLPPMTQLDLSATAMRPCFQSTPDLKPYGCLPNRVKLDEMNPDLDKLQGAALHWAKKSLTLDFGEADKADEDTLNRILWHATRGYDTPYPEQYAGKADD